ncbi:toxin-activating lysine-acyltransferase [Methylocystis echinoides]|uniref:RTX toxin-activating lysine-acyltransferase n=1 Tax=Methylocystis echinoides TaxID=29468 RepID=A0A9W6GVZ0_9HYPH|nr:toxin-activating lysine-acyltransferase [Methylocystis echinoides]GLI94037.1 hypothetical protein LMG27198_30290 [Methylocystis echinoides]
MGLFSTKSQTNSQSGSINKADAVIIEQTAEPSPETRSVDKQVSPVEIPSAPADTKFATYGKILSMLSSQKPFGAMPLGQVAGIVGPAIDAGQFVIAHGHRKDSPGPGVPVAFVLWAKVSEELDRKLSENSREPILVEPQDWRSGDIPWLILSVGVQQVVVPTMKAISEKHFPGQTFKARFPAKDGGTEIRHISLE